MLIGKMRQLVDNKENVLNPKSGNPRLLIDSFSSPLVKK